MANMLANEDVRDLNQFVLTVTASWLIPQVPGPEVLAILMYPASPQPVPHEFFTRMYFTPPSVPYPAARTA